LNDTIAHTPYVVMNDTEQPPPYRRKPSELQLCQCREISDERYVEAMDE
jgi:hypothetical protein